MWKALRRWKKCPGMYDTASGRAHWKHEHKKEAAFMVKGTNRRVIVVRSPDPKVFEEAIFVLREDYARHRSAEQVMEEARRAVSDYLKKCAPDRRKTGQRIRGAAIAAAGTLAASAAWLSAHFTGV